MVEQRVPYGGRELTLSLRRGRLISRLEPQASGAEPVATYVEARRSSDGQEVDRVACAEALTR